VEPTFTSLEEAGRLGATEGPILCLERTLFLDRRADLAADATVLGLVDLARLVLPGPRSSDAAALLRHLGHRGGFDPAAGALRDILAALVERVRTLPPLAREVLGAVLSLLPDRYAKDDPLAARHARAAFEILGQPAAGRLSRLVGDVAEAIPRFGEGWDDGEPLPVVPDAPVALDEEERAALDRVFSEILPGAFAAEAGAADPRPYYRKPQHDLARRILEQLEAGEFLVVDAPTGTGKTLAYLVPALLWARKAGVRLAVSTFTRALQEQAFQREIRRALAALEAAGVTGGFRASLLKGRANYVCGKKLAALAPDAGGDPNDLLAWGTLALFHLTDSEGDLDGLPAVSPLPTERDAGSAALRRLRDAVRAESGCCVRREERRRCGAECARRRAERSHVVVTNHAFLFANPEIFKIAIFDESEHLHPQALTAASREVRLAAVEALLAEVHAPGAIRSRAILHEIVRRGRGRRLRDAGDEEGPGGGLDRAARTAEEEWERGGDALERLRGEAESFLAWKAAELERRDRREAHALLREFALSMRGVRLVRAHADLVRSLSSLEAALATVSEELSLAPFRGSALLRARITGARGRLAETAQGLDSFLPAPDGVPAFDAAYFYDVEEDPFRRGGVQLARRLLLPPVYLGRQFLPAFRGGVFVSAANVLAGSFEPIAAYLGLDLLREMPRTDAAALPGETRSVSTFRVPGTLDFGRVLLAIPDDAPPFSNEPGARRRFVSYVSKFLRRLGEAAGGRMLVLFTAAEDLRRVASEVAPFFEERGILLYWQGMEGAGKEELARRFRGREDPVLMGVDTFWFGVDFPGATVEYLVIVKLPYGRLDPYHWAQIAALGDGEQRRRIYLPRALGMFRQGFGRLLRTAEDRGAVFVLDRRILEGRGRLFLGELPGLSGESDESAPRVLSASTEECIRAALAHTGRPNSGPSSPGIEIGEEGL